MRRGRSLLGALAAVLLMTPTAATAAATALDDPGVRVTAAFDRDARLGSDTALHVSLHVDPRLRPEPVTAISIRYHEQLGVTTSGLGLDPCSRSPATYAAVVLPDTATRWGGCPRNSVMAYGHARGQVRLDEVTAFTEEAELSVFAGPIRDGTLQVETQVDGINPVGARLVYSGALLPARPPWGGTLAIALPQLPAEWGASIALLDVALTIADGRIRYRRSPRGRLFRPTGILLPSRCPRGGFPVEAEFAFADAQRDSVTVAIPCPRRSAA